MRIKKKASTKHCFGLVRFVPIDRVRKITKTYNKESISWVGDREIKIECILKARLIFFSLDRMHFFFILMRLSTWLTVFANINAFTMDTVLHFPQQVMNWSISKQLRQFIYLKTITIPFFNQINRDRQKYRFTLLHYVYY